MKQRKFINSLLATAALSILAAGCTQQDDVFVPDGESTALRVVAEKEGQMLTRASGTAWDDGDVIGISVASTAGSTTGSNVPYAIDGGTWTATNESLCFHDAQNVTFRAYYPYTADLTDGKITKTITADDQTDANRPKIDYMFASGATASMVSPTVAFTGDNAFKHRMCRIELNIIAGTGMTDLGGLTACTLKGLVMEGTFNTSDGKAEINPTATATDLTVALSGATGRSHTISLIVFPQEVAEGFTVAVERGYELYEFTLKAEDNTLKEGNSYTYTVAINRTQPIGNFVDPAKTGKGDFVMSDGSFVASGDELTDVQKAACRGIVFWTTADSNTTGSTPAKLTDDAVMSADFPSCTHGLIVSVKDASQSCAWQGVYEGGQQKNYESVYDTFQNTSLFNADGKSYAAIESGTGADQNINKILGYQSTQVLRAYNKYCSETSGKGDYTVQAVAALDQWAASNPAPANTTGWFLPSVKELHMLCYKDVDNVWDAYGSEKTDTKNLVNGSLSKVSGDQFGSYYYWSSSEGADYSNLAFNVSFNLAYVYSYIKDYTDRVRAVCAY